MPDTKPDVLMDVFTGVIALAAVAQAVATAFVGRLTNRLAASTDAYAQTTNDALELSRDQLERDWRPDVRIADIQRRGPGDVVLSIANIARPDVLVKQIKMRRVRRPDEAINAQDDLEKRLVALVPGGQVLEVTITIQMSNCRGVWNAPPDPPQRSVWKTDVDLALVFESARGENQTPWFNCAVTFSDWQVISITIPG